MGFEFQGRTLSGPFTLVAATSVSDCSDHFVANVPALIPPQAAAKPAQLNRTTMNLAGSLPVLLSW
jgi:hypothetical protein